MPNQTKKEECICNHPNPKDCFPKIRCACKVHGNFSSPHIPTGEEKHLICKHCDRSKILNSMIGQNCWENKDYNHEWIEEPMCKLCSHPKICHTSNGCNVGTCHMRYAHRFSPIISTEVSTGEDYISTVNNFIKKWCGENASHLLDSDENDGQRLRDLLLSKEKEVKEGLRRIGKKYKGDGLVGKRGEFYEDFSKDVLSFLSNNQEDK